MTTVLKLSELDDAAELGREDQNTIYTVADLKREIIELGEPHHLYDDWYTVIPQKWRPDAKYMLESYIENEYQEMYEDWDERAMDCITDEVARQIQAILDKAFSSGHATDYWTFDKKVEIDIIPHEVGDQT